MNLLTDNPRVEVVKEPFAVYQAFPALNHSALKLSDIHGKGCPRKAWVELNSATMLLKEVASRFLVESATEDEPEDDAEQKDDPTAAMAFGTLYHSFLLEPADFLKTAAVLDGVMKPRLFEEAIAAKSKAKGFSKALGTYRAWKAECERNGLQVVDEKVALKMENMREQLFRDTEIADELAAVTHSETSVYFGMPAEGTAMKAPFIQCKARLDMHYPGVIGDLKTCRSAHPLEFAKDIPKLGYDTQLAWYRMGARCAGLDVSRCFLLA